MHTIVIFGDPDMENAPAKSPTEAGLDINANTDVPPELCTPLPSRKNERTQIQSTGILI